MYIHGGGQAGIMHLCAIDSILKYDSAPFPVYLFAISQENHTRFNSMYFFLGIFWRKSQAIMYGWTRKHIPEFGYILMRKIQGPLLRQLR